MSVSGRPGGFREFSGLDLRSNATALLSLGVLRWVAETQEPFKPQPRKRTMSALRQPRGLAVAGMALLAGIGFSACAPAQESAAPQGRTGVESPVLPLPALHHVGMNVVDPQASIDWYGRLWPNGRATTVADMPAFEADMLLIFNQVETPAPGTWNNIGRSHRVRSGTSGSAPTRRRQPPGSTNWASPASPCSGALTIPSKSGAPAK